MNGLVSIIDIPRQSVDEVSCHLPTFVTMNCPTKPGYWGMEQHERKRIRMRPSKPAQGCRQNNRGIPEEWLAPPHLPSCWLVGRTNNIIRQSLPAIRERQIVLTRVIIGMSTRI